MSLFGSIQKAVFNKAYIAERMYKKVRIALYGAGGYGAKTMRTGMKNKATISSVGQYPNAHEGRLKDLVLFGVNEKMLSLVVGPTLYPGSKDTAERTQTIPNLINYGGIAVRTFKKGAFKTNPKRVTQRYLPRPFVALTKPKVAAILLHNLEGIPL